MSSYGNAKKAGDIKFKVMIKDNTTSGSCDVNFDGVEGISKEIENGVKKSYTEAQKDILEIIKKKIASFQKIKTWEEAKTLLVGQTNFKKTYNAPLKELPTLSSEVKVTFERALKEGNNTSIKNINAEYDKRKDKIHKCKDPYSTTTLGAIQNLIFDKTKKKDAFDKLRQGFLKDIGTNIFAPRVLKKYELSGGKIGLVYLGYQNRKFTVILDAEGKTKSVKGRNLNLKPAGLRGNTGKDKMFVSNMNFNSAHLIADWFGGPGQTRAYNIVTTSDHYNKKTMYNVEESMVDEFIEFVGRYKTSNSFEDCYLNLDVKIDYEDFDNSNNLSIIVDKIIAEEISNYKDKTKAELTDELMKFYQKHKKEASLDLHRVKNVTYLVKYVAIVNGKKEEQVRNHETGTPDIWLGLSKE